MNDEQVQTAVEMEASRVLTWAMLTAGVWKMTQERLPNRYSTRYELVDSEDNVINAWVLDWPISYNGEKLAVGDIGKKLTPNLFNAYNKEFARSCVIELIDRLPYFALTKALSHIAKTIIDEYELIGPYFPLHRKEEDVSK